MHLTRLALRLESQPALFRGRCGIVSGVKWRLTNVFDELDYAFNLRKVFEKQKTNELHAGAAQRYISGKG